MPDEWLQTGQICATIANSVRTKGKAFQPTDFMPRVRSKVKQSAEQIRAGMRMMKDTWNSAKKQKRK